MSWNYRDKFATTAEDLTDAQDLDAQDRPTGDYSADVRPPAPSAAPAADATPATGPGATEDHTHDEDDRDKDESDAS